MVTSSQIQKRLLGTSARLTMEEAHEHHYPWLALISLAASGAGTGMQMAAQEKARKAQEEARQAELNRQAQFKAEAEKVSAKSISESTANKAQADIEAAAEDRAAAYRAITGKLAQTAPGATNPAAASKQPVAASGPALVGGAQPSAVAARNMAANAAAWNRILGGAQARGGGYGDWSLARNIAAQRAGNQLSAIGGMARGSADVLGAELDDASHAGDSLAAAGAGLSLAGSIGGAAAGSGFGGGDTGQLQYGDTTNWYLGRKGY